jgi:hypothetical protein
MPDPGLVYELDTWDTIIDRKYWAQVLEREWAILPSEFEAPVLDSTHMTSEDV